MKKKNNNKGGRKNLKATWESWFAACSCWFPKFGLEYSFYEGEVLGFLYTTTLRWRSIEDCRIVILLREKELYCGSRYSIAMNGLSQLHGVWWQYEDYMHAGNKISSHAFSNFIFQFRIGKYFSQTVLLLWELYLIK